MSAGRIAVLVLSFGVAVMWLLSWAPRAVLPEPLYAVLYWTGGALTLLLLPAAVGIAWALWTRPQSRGAGPKDSSSAHF